MPKKRKKSKVFRDLDVLADSANLSAAETVVHPQEVVRILDKFVTTVQQGYTTEKTMLTGVFRMPSSWDPAQGEELQEAVIEFWLAGKISTDAAAGTTSMRVYVDGTLLLSVTLAEANSQTSRDIIWGGIVTLGPSDGGLGVGTGANGSAYRINEAALHSTGVPTTAVTTSVAGLTFSYTEDVTVTVTLQTTDAGTQLDECHGWMKITHRLPVDEIA